jgi:hypothetical protein
VGDDVVNFYKKVLVPAGSISAEDPYQNFFYYVEKLARPWDGFSGHQMCGLIDEGKGQRTRYILFYMATKIVGSQQGGIMYSIFFEECQSDTLTKCSLDQHTGQATAQADLFSIEPSSIIWQPLLGILTRYLNLITLGKVTSANFKSALEVLRPGEAEPQHPWKYHSYSPEILARTLAAYHTLIDSIEAGRIDSIEGDDHELTVYLSTHFNLDAASFPKDCFARSFLTAARRPRGPKRIRYIAPGIELPSFMSIRDQPFRAAAKKYRFASGVPGMPSVGDEESNDPLYPPFLLFPGDGVKVNTSASGDRSVFAAPFDELDELPLGLWLDRSEPWGGRGGEDEAVMVAPFENHGRAGSSFEPGNKLPLFAVLEEWTEMVERGRWKVDERGVMGDIALLQVEHGATRGRSRFRGNAGLT